MRITEDEFPWLPFLLQTSDTLFPTGSYAHSLGFEEMVRVSGIADEASLQRFLLTQSLPALREQELPYLRFAYEARDLRELCDLDHEISAWKLAEELRAASIQLGVRRLKALRVICEDARLGEFESAVERGEARGHQLIVCALQAHMEDVPLTAALAVYLYQALAAVCAAALKLMRIGQEGCQRALRSVTKHTVGAVRASLLVARADAGWFNPLLEIASLRHSRAGERLFIS